MRTLVIKRGDTKPKFLDVPLLDGARIPYDDLAGCTLSFLLKGGAIAFKRSAEITSKTIDAVAVAQFEYQPVAEDVAQTGKFKQEWELVYPSGKPLTFPNGGYNAAGQKLPDYNTVKIVADLG
jgi:hypothetical protein